jgi:hypothetical protein
MVAAQKRRHTRETLHRCGQRLAARVEDQLGTLSVDLFKEEEESTSLKQSSRRKRKGVERPVVSSSLDTRDPPQTRYPKLRCKKWSYVKAGGYMRLSVHLMRATHCSANPILQKRVLSKYMSWRMKDHWNKPYKRTRTKVLGMLRKGPKSTGGDVD